MLWTTALWSWHHLNYSVQRVSTFSFCHRLVVLACVSAVHVAVGAFLYRLVSGDPWSYALFKTYGVLFRAPGFAVSNEPTLAASLVVNTLFIFGMFVFAVLIGMISDEIKQQIHAMRVGDVELRLRGHTLVLNWNSLTMSLLRQLCHAQQDPKHRLFKKPVVVLADRPKVEMDTMIHSAMRGLKFEVFIRSGRPSKQQDLQRVAAHAAGTILLLQPEPCSSEIAAQALKVATLISLRCLQLTQSASSYGTYYQPGSGRQAVRTVIASICRWLGGVSLALIGRRLLFLDTIRISRASSSFSGGQGDAMRVVVQVPSMRQDEDDLLGFLHGTTASVSNVQAARLLSQHMLDRLVAETAVQPGTGHAFREILRAGGDSAQLRFCDVNQQLAQTFKAAQHKFADAVLLGVLSTDDRQLHINPPDALPLTEGDRLLGFTRQASLSQTPQHTSAGWRRLGRPMSRASSMSSRRLHVVPSNSNMESDSLPHTGTSASPEKAVNIIVLGWADTAVHELLRHLQETAPKGSCFTVLHEEEQQQGKEGAAVAAAAVAAAAAAAVVRTVKPDSSSAVLAPFDSMSGRTEHQQQSPGVTARSQHSQQQFTCRHLYFKDPGSVQSLIASGIAQADSLIVGGHLGPQASGEADAMVVAALLAVQQALLTASEEDSQQSSGTPDNESRQEQDAGVGSHSTVRRSDCGGSLQLHVVAVLSSYSLRRAAQTFLGSMLMRNFSYEIMVLDEYAAAMLVQVAQDPATSLVMDQLLVQTSGCSLVMWPADMLGFRPGMAVTFRDVCRATRRYSSTALGYRRADGRMLMAPAATDEVCFQKGDTVVAIKCDA